MRSEWNHCPSSFSAYGKRLCKFLAIQLQWWELRLSNFLFCMFHIVSLDKFLVIQLYCSPLELALCFSLWQKNNWPGLLGRKCGCSCSPARKLLPANLQIGFGLQFKAFASSRKSEKKLTNDRKISKTTQRKELLSKDFMDMSDEATSGNDTDFSNRIELANNNLGADGSTSYPTRGQVLQACIITSGLLLALGATIRQAAHVASVEGWAVLDSSEVSFGFEMWHLELILGLVLLISSSRYLLLKTWPDFSQSSEAANQQILGSLEPLDYILVAFLPGISEELLFRGALMPLFGLNWISALAVAAIFGVLHLGSGRRYSFAIWATFVGFAYGAATLISSSIIVPMASHSLNNLVGGLLWRLTSINPKERDK